MIEAAHSAALTAAHSGGGTPAAASLPHDASHPPHRVLPPPKVVVGPLRPVRQLLQRLVQRRAAPVQAEVGQANRAATPRRASRHSHDHVQHLGKQPALAAASGPEEQEDDVADVTMVLQRHGDVPARSSQPVAPRGELDGAAAATDELQPTVPGNEQLLQVSCHQEVALRAEEDVEQVASSKRRRGVRPLGRALRGLVRHVLRPLGRGLASLASHFRPRGVGHNDQTWPERVLNIASCAPFFSVGVTVLRHSTGAPARRFGRLFLLVSTVATAYHASPGQGLPRLVLRMMDHWTIALSAGALRHAVYHPGAAQQQRQQQQQQGGGGGIVGAAGRATGVLACVLRVGSVVAIPLCPSLVSSANFLLVEVGCLVLACRSPDRRTLRQYLVHATSSALAGGSYVLEDRLADEEQGRVAPGMHAAWHVMGALAILTAQPFVLLVDHSAGGKPAAVA